MFGNNYTLSCVSVCTHCPYDPMWFHYIVLLRTLSKWNSFICVLFCVWFWLRHVKLTFSKPFDYVFWRFRTELCRFSGHKIYPGRGIRFIRSDSQVLFFLPFFCKKRNVSIIFMISSQVFLFINSKCKHYFHNKLKPSKLAWTTMYRKQHKKVN